MTEDQKYEIAVLSEACSSAKLKFECLGMQNTGLMTHDEKIKSRIQYHIAETEYYEALAKLQKAQARIAAQ